jgi:hypothetical protein
MLVAPGGHSALVMSDVGRVGAADGVTLTLDDGAAEELPFGTLATGTYRPRDIDEMFDSSDLLPPPAPETPDRSALTAFTGADPNGVWSLYVYDDSYGGPACSPPAGAWKSLPGARTARPSRTTTRTP